MNYTRKSFLKILGLSTGAASLSPYIMKASNSVTSESLFDDNPLKLGIASYTLRKYSLEDALKITTKLGIKHIALKSMHLPLESTEEEIQVITKKVKDTGIELYGAGVIYMKSKKDVDNAFRYASAANIKVIIGVPDPAMLKYVEKKVKETNIKVAIHNHGPEDDIFPSPESVYEKIKELDKRIGLCIDVGHTTRLGLNASKNIKKYADRLYDVHLKDVKGITPKEISEVFGHGIINIPEIIKTLKEINYTGIIAIEFEKDPDDVVSGLSESIGYTRGIIETQKKDK